MINLILISSMFDSGSECINALPTEFMLVHVRTWNMVICIFISYVVYLMNAVLPIHSALFYNVFSYHSSEGGRI